MPKFMALICPPGQKLRKREQAEEIELPPAVGFASLLLAKEVAGGRRLMSAIEDYLPTIAKAGWEVLSFYLDDESEPIPNLGRVHRAIVNYRSQCTTASQLVELIWVLRPEADKTRSFEIGSGSKPSSDEPEPIPSLNQVRAEIVRYRAESKEDIHLLELVWLLADEVRNTQQAKATEDGDPIR